MWWFYHCVLHYEEKDWQERMKWLLSGLCILWLFGYWKIHCLKEQISLHPALCLAPPFDWECNCCCCSLINLLWLYQLNFHPVEPASRGRKKINSPWRNTCLWLFRAHTVPSLYWISCLPFSTKRNPHTSWNVEATVLGLPLLIGQYYVI